MSGQLNRLHQEADAILETSSMNTERGKQQKKTLVKDEAYDLVDALLNLQDQGKLEFKCLSTNEIKAIILVSMPL